MSMILTPDNGPMGCLAPDDAMALSTAPSFLDVSSLVTAGRREDQWFPAYGRMPAQGGLSGTMRTCPGRGAALFTMHRRAGTHRQPAWSMDPGSAAHPA